jgi:hypothetical protein
MTDFDRMFDYFRNINTRPGPGAGHSIDPSKPGPDADRIAFLERQRGLYEMNEADAAIVSDIDEELARLRGARSDAEPVALDKFQRGRIAHKAAMAILPEETVGDGEYWRLRCAINDVLREEFAQSNAEPDTSDIPEVSAEWFEKAKLVMPQPDAEPVAWRVRDFKDRWVLCHSREQAEKYADVDAGNLIQSLYLARADASAGLIEAAVLERYAQSIAMWCYRENVTDYERLSYIANHPVTRKYANRARAADRSGK